MISTLAMANVSVILRSAAWFAHAALALSRMDATRRRTCSAKEEAAPPPKPSDHRDSNWLSAFSIWAA
jgi:hypothetical protein